MICSLSSSSCPLHLTIISSWGTKKRLKHAKKVTWCWVERRRCGFCFYNEWVFRDTTVMGGKWRAGLSSPSLICLFCSTTLTILSIPSPSRLFYCTFSCLFCLDFLTESVLSFGEGEEKMGCKQTAVTLFSRTRTMRIAKHVSHKCSPHEANRRIKRERTLETVRMGGTSHPVWHSFLLPSERSAQYASIWQHVSWNSSLQYHSKMRQNKLVLTVQCLHRKTLLWTRFWFNASHSILESLLKKVFFRKRFAISSHYKLVSLLSFATDGRAFCCPHTLCGWGSGWSVGFCFARE